MFPINKQYPNYLEGLIYKCPKIDAWYNRE